jgi:hypothetical protein
MPEYCFTERETGEPLTLFLTVSQLERRRRKDGSIRHGGRIYDRDKGAEFRGGFTGKAKWPILSDAAGVHPDQIPEMSERMRKSGVNLDFASDGRAIFQDSAQRRAALKVLGLHDRSGYG